MTKQLIGKNNQLLPFCIYYKEDKNSNIIYSHLGAPELIVDNDGENPRYKCMDMSLLYRGWKPYGVFYGLDPQFRPIPRGMILLCARWRRGFPYHTFEVRHLTDPYNLEQDLYSGCMYFFAYDHPANNTVPLYFYTFKMPIQHDDILLPSFHRDMSKLPQPGKDNGVHIEWERAPIPVVHVIAPDRTTEECPTCLTQEDIKKIKFSNVNNACVPDMNGKYDSIGDCIVTSNTSKNSNLLQMVADDAKKDTGIRKFFKSIPNYGTSIILAVFVFSFLMVIMFSSQSTK